MSRTPVAVLPAPMEALAKKENVSTLVKIKLAQQIVYVWPENVKRKLVITIPVWLVLKVKPVTLKEFVSKTLAKI